MKLPSPSSDSLPLLNSLAQHLRSNPAYMASVLATYQKQEIITDAVLAKRLELSEVQLPRLALCKRPRQTEDNFQKDVRQIAEYIGVNEIALAQMLRQIEVIEAFQEFPPSIIDDVVLSPSKPSVLAAARDHEKAKPSHESDQKKTNEEEEN